jgi:glycosidase
MIKIRHDNEILTDGKLNMKTISNKKGVIIITRELENERIIGIINISDKEIEIKLQLNKNEIFDLINEQRYEVENGELTVMIEENDFLLLK